MPLLEVKDLRKSYGNLEVVRGVSLSLEPGGTFRGEQRANLSVTATQSERPW